MWTRLTDLVIDGSREAIGVSRALTPAASIAIQTRLPVVVDVSLAHRTHAVQRQVPLHPQMCLRRAR